MDLVLPTIVAALAALVLLFALLRGAWRWSRGRRRSLCPGPRLGARPWLVPLWIVHRPTCGYDLAGHLAPGPRRMPLDHSVTCPECGRVVRRRRELIAHPAAWSPVGMATVLLLGAWLLHRHPPLDGGLLVASASTDVLLSGEGVLGTTTPIEIRDELRRRAMDHRMSPEEIRRFVVLLVNDLRDDRLVGNAKDAMEKLAIFGAFDAAPLLAALDSADRQQRRLAAGILREMPGVGLEADPPESLIRVTIEDLRDDGIAWNSHEARSYLATHIARAAPWLVAALDSDDDQQRQAAMRLLRDATEHPAVTPAVRARIIRAEVADLANETSDSTAWVAFHSLRRHAAEVEPFLAEGMRLGDGRTRLLAAAAAGCTNREALLSQAAPILIGHLGDNAIRCDAVVAARALFGFGPAIVPFLDRALSGDLARGDEQLRQSLTYLRARLTTTRSAASLQRELPLARLTTEEVDALGRDPDELDIPWFPVR